MKIKVLNMSYYYAKFKYSPINECLQNDYDLNRYDLNKIYIYVR